SAFVMVMEAASGSQLEREPLPETLEHARVHAAHFLVGQRSVSGSIGDRVREALLSLRNRGAAVAIEEADGLDAVIGQRPDLLDGRPPAHARLLDAEVREDVLDDPLQVTELDRRPGALRPARRPGTVQEDRKGAALLPAPLRVQAVPLADLERADEAGAEAEV